MNRLVAFLAVVSMFCLVPALRADDTKLASKDEKFIMNAATGGEVEVSLGTLGSTRGQSEDVKKFGQKMAEDHGKANGELKDLAKSKNVDLAKAQDKATKMESKEQDSLAKKEGADFDKAYMDMMVKDHEKDVKEFENAANKGEDSDVKAWAAKTLPTLQEHLQMAKDIQSKLGK